MNQPTRPRTSDEQIEYNISQVVATQAMSGHFLTEEDKQELRDMHTGKISIDELVAKHNEKYKALAEAREARVRAWQEDPQGGVYYIYNPETNTELFGNITKRPEINGAHDGWDFIIKQERPLGEALAEFISIGAELSDLDKYSGIIPINAEMHADGNFYLRLGIRMFLKQANMNKVLFTKDWMDMFLRPRPLDKPYKFLTNGKLQGLMTISMRLCSDGALESSWHGGDSTKEWLADYPRKTKTVLFLEHYENQEAVHYRSLELLIRNNKMPKQCKLCGKYFIPEGRSDTAYCSRQTPQDPTKTCKEYSLGHVRRKRVESNEALSLYNRLYDRKRIKYARKKDEESRLDFENFKRESAQWRKDIKSGARTEEDFIKWLKAHITP